MVALQMENVIASSSLGKEVELVRLGSELAHAHYAGGRTPSVVVDLDGDGAGGRTGVVFGNGKLYVIGVDDLTTGREAVSQLRNAVKALDPKVSLRKGVKLENLVARCDFGTTLDLDTIAASLPGAEYDPVRFSGLVLRLDNPAASFILFRSGIVIVTDVGSEAGVKRALKALETFLRASSLLG